MILEECIEFSVFLPNQPGIFAKLSERLTEHGVRIRVFMLYTSYVMNLPDTPVVTGMCKMVVINNEKARQTFEELGFRYREEKGLLLRTQRRTDVLPLILDKLAAAGLNLIDAYGVLPTEDDELLVALSVSDEHKGYELASQLDWSIPDEAPARAK
jgi:hypothetical protein